MANKYDSILGEYRQADTTDLSGYVPYTGATTNLDMGVFTVKTPSLLNYASILTVDIDNRSLNDDMGDPQLYWSSSGISIPTRILGVDNNFSIDPNNRWLQNTSNYTTFDYGNALLYDVGGVHSIALSNRFFTASDGATQLLNYYNTTGAFLYGSSGTGFGDGTFTIRARIHANNSAAEAVYARFTNLSTGTTATDGLDIGIDNIGIAEIRNRENTAIKFYTANINYASLLSNEPTLQLDSQGSNSANAGKIVYRTSGGAESFTTTFNASDNNFYFLYGATTVGSVTSTGWGFGVAAFDNSATVHIRSTAEQLRIDNNGSSHTKITQTGGHSLGFVPASNGTTSFMFYKAGGTTSVAQIDTTNSRVGINTTPAAALHVLATTEQFRASYSAINYWSATTDSSGTTTFNAAGSVPAFIFSDPVTINGLLTLSAQNIVTDTTTGTKIGTGTTQKLGFYNATPIVQGASVADATGGATIDAEARTAINALISRIEALGLIATI